MLNMITKNNSILDNTLEDERFKSFDLKLCLDNIDSDTLRVIEIIQETTKNIIIEYNNRILRLRERKPRCPHCRSYKVCNHQIEDRTLHFFHVANFKLKVDRYKCTKCNRTFMTDLTLIVRKSANFTRDACEKFLDDICESESTLFATKYRWENKLNHTKHYKSFISHQSIENYLLFLSQQLEPFDNLSSQGYLVFDVQWIKLRKIWKYRFALYDIYEDRLIAEKIYDHENNENITEFLTENTKNITVKCITTDLATNYRKIIQHLGYNHQYCHFHAKKTINKYINRKLRNLNKSRENRAQKIIKHLFTGNIENPEKEYQKYHEYTEEIKKYTSLKKELYEILDEKDYDKGLERVNQLIEHLNDYKGQIKKFIKNRLQNQYRNFKIYLEDDKIEKTSNKIENFFSKTMSKKFKRKYRTNEGILARIHLNEIRLERNKLRRKYYTTT